MRNALPASILVHVALLGGAWLALNWSPAPDETGVESVSVDIVSLEEFTSTATSTAQSSATETLVAAGAKAIEPVETTEAAEPVETAVAEPVEAEAEATDPVETASVQAAPTEPVEVEETVSAEVLMAALTETAVPVEGLAPVSVSAIATQVTPTAPEVLEPIEELAPVAPRPLPRPKFETKVAEAKPEPKKPEPKKSEQEKPTKKKPVAEQPKKTKPVQAGNGGKSNADVAASAPSGGKGASDAAGNAAVSKYPGQVQRALRRALRFPKGAGSARGEVQVTFVVSSSGAASQIAVSQSSGHAVLDKEAIATVKRAAPFPPIPEAAGRNSWTFTMPLAFTR
jgi:protein TonB